MELNAQIIKRIAELSRLELSETEVKQYQTDLQKILHAFSDLANISLPEELQGDARSGLILEQSDDLKEEVSRLQEDKVDNSLSTQSFLEQAPEREGVFVRVPAILTSTT